jgi:DNA-binding NarL/FixJ family response regulator
MPVNICIIEDDKNTREAVVQLIGRYENLQCTGAFASGEIAMREIQSRHPEVVLVDIRLPKMSGIECVAKLKALMPKVQVLMVTTYDESDLIFDSLRAGASGYLLKRTLNDELATAVEQVLAGGSPMSMQIARRVVNYFQKAKQTTAEMEGLTSRQREVLALLAKGLAYKEIAAQLGISLNTVRMHQRCIYEKLHVHCRTDAVMKFVGER